MSRLFKTVDFEATLDTSVRLGDCLPTDHLARFVVDIVKELDLKPIYERYGNRGGAPYAPEILLGLLFYAYATGVFSSRKIEQGVRETAAFRYLAGNLSPDHDTIAAFRKQFLPQLQDLFVQILLLAQEMGLLTLGNLSLDGTRIHADASKSKAVSYKRLLQIEAKLQAEVADLFTLADNADTRAVPEGMHAPYAIARREERLQRLAEAKLVLQARAAERAAFEQIEYEAKRVERQAQEESTGKKPRGKPPTPPSSTPKDGDQYNFTYWPYGEEQNRTRTTPTPFRFVGTRGSYRDSASRDYERARVLDKLKGRWLTQDPIRFQGGDWNLYRYALNNPVRYVDPSGYQRTLTSPIAEPTTPPTPITPETPQIGPGAYCVGGIAIICIADACYELCTYKPGHPTGPIGGNITDPIIQECYPDPDPDDPGEYPEYPNDPRRRCLGECQRRNSFRRTAILRSRITPQWCKDRLFQRPQTWLSDCFNDCVKGCARPPYKPGTPNPPNKCSLSFARTWICGDGRDVRY